jgi:trigger factor
MQVSVERIDDLNRKVTVEVPEATIREQVDARLKTLARQAKFDGFRPGKVPSMLVRQRYGKQVREEVLSELVESTFARAVQDEKLKPAGFPQITAKGGVDGEGFVYEAAFEVFPEFVLMPVETLELKRYTSSVTPKDVDDMIQRLREQRQTWREVTRAGQNGDRLILSIEGTIDGETLGNGKIADFPYVLGGAQLFEGFGEKLVGATAGSHHAFDLTLATNYPRAEWAGKTAHFEVDVSKVEEAVLPELDEAFIRSFGIESGDLDALQEDVRQNMERELNRALKSRTKGGVMDVLFEKNAITLPKSLVEQELRQLVAAQAESAKAAGRAVDESALRARYDGLAQRRVALGLILSKLVELSQIKVDAKKVREAVQDLADSYEQPEQVVHWYYSNEQNLKEVENVVLEDQVIEWILQRAQASEESVPFSELVQAPAAS